MASNNGTNKKVVAKKEKEVERIPVEVEQIDYEGVLSIEIRIPSGGSVHGFILTPANWGLMEDAQAMAERLEVDAKLDEPQLRESVVVGEFFDKYVVGGKATVPYWLGQSLFKTVVAHVEKYRDVEIKN